MGFSKNDFEKVDLRIKKITEQTVEQIEVDSELPPTIEQLEDNNKTYSIMAAILFIDIRKSTYLTENSQAKSMVKICEWRLIVLEKMEELQDNFWVTELWASLLTPLMKTGVWWIVQQIKQSMRQEVYRL